VELQYFDALLYAANMSPFYKKIKCQKRSLL
jgi:hypothetical protein